MPRWWRLASSAVRAWWRRQRRVGDWRCGRCGMWNTLGELRCWNCGKALEP